MGNIVFDTKTDRVIVEGAEREWCKSLIYDACFAALGRIPVDATAVWDGLVHLGYQVKGTWDAKTVEKLCLNLGSLFRDRAMITDASGDKHVWSILQLNTAMRSQNPMVQLAARIHGQCEIHAFVRGPNKAWLADLIEVSIASGYLRLFDYPQDEDKNKSGWRALCALLRKNDTEDVVMSYGGCNMFPDPDVLDWEEKDLQDKCDQWRQNNQEGDDPIQMKGDIFAELGSDQTWDRCLVALHPTLELEPTGFGDFYFDDGKSIHDLVDLFRVPAAAAAAVESKTTDGSKKRPAADDEDNDKRPPKRHKTEPRQMKINQLWALAVRHNPGFKNPDLTLYNLEFRLRAMYDAARSEYVSGTIDRAALWTAWEKEWNKRREVRSQAPSVDSMDRWNERERRNARMFRSRA